MVTALSFLSVRALGNRRAPDSLHLLGDVSCEAVTPWRRAVPRRGP